MGYDGLDLGYACPEIHLSVWPTLRDRQGFKDAAKGSFYGKKKGLKTRTSGPSRVEQVGILGWDSRNFLSHRLKTPGDADKCSGQRWSCI